jgi:hypothetical protein
MVQIPPHPIISLNEYFPSLLWFCGFKKYGLCCGYHKIQIRKIDAFRVEQKMHKKTKRPKITQQKIPKRVLFSNLSALLIFECTSTLSHKFQ